MVKGDRGEGRRRERDVRGKGRKEGEGRREEREAGEGKGDKG